MTRVVLLVTGLCLLLGGAALMVKHALGLPTGVVTYQQVLSRPEAHLYYPGAHVVESHGDDEQPSLLEGNRPAFVQTYLVVSDAARAQVDDWYRTKLTTSGWHVDLKTDADVSYARGTRESFTIGFAKVAPTGIPWDGRGTLYNIHYQLAPCSQAGVSCFW